MDHIQGHELCRANGDEKLPGIIKMIRVIRPFRCLQHPPVLIAAILFALERSIE